jgi:outer membrane immunogenic protein
MKKIKISALALAITSVMTGAVMAQSSSSAWEGLNASASLGYGQFTPKMGNGTYAGAYPLTATASDLNTPLANLSLGYDFGLGNNFTLGLGGVYYLGASGAANGSFSVLGNAVPIRYQVKNNYSFYVAPGYAIDKDRMVYAKVGYAASTLGVDGLALEYANLNLGGYNLGLGYKQMISKSFYVVGEANYVNLSSKTANLKDVTGAPISVPVGGSGMNFLLGIGYRF